MHSLSYSRLMSGYNYSWYRWFERGSSLFSNMGNSDLSNHLSEPGNLLKMVTVLYFSDSLPGTGGSMGWQCFLTNVEAPGACQSSQENCPSLLCCINSCIFLKDSSADPVYLTLAPHTSFVCLFLAFSTFT